MPGVADRRIGSSGPAAVNLYGEDRDGQKAEDKQRREELHQKVFDASTAQEEWRPDAIESYQFVSGEQWSEADLEVLRKTNRPAIVVNKILGPVQFLSGLQRTQRTEPSFIPVEGNDVRTAEVIKSLYKYHQQVGDFIEADNALFEDKIITGLCWKKVVLKYDNGDIEGRPVEIRRHPLSIFPDPNFWDGGRDQMLYVCDAMWLTKKEAMKMWPEHKEEISSRWGDWMDASGGAGLYSGTEGTAGETTGDSHSDTRFFWDPKQQRCRIVEIWEVETDEQWVAVMPDGKLETDKEVVKRIKAAMMLNPELQNEIAVAKTQVRKVYVSHLLDDIVLSDKLPSPFASPELPFFPSRGFYYWRTPFGMVKPMKDPQREKNRRRSSIIEMVQKTPNTGWINNKNGGAKTEDIEQYAHGSGVVINHEGQEPKRIDPPPIPVVLDNLEMRGDQEIRSVVNINDELLGSTTQKTVSGRAIEARQRSGVIVQEPLLENFRLDMARAAKFTVKAIQQYCTPQKARRILGQMIQRDPNNPQMQALAQQDEFELVEILNNAMATEFDVLIDNNKPYEPSLKAQNFQALSELAEKMPNYPPPPDVMIAAAKEAGVIDDQSAQQWLASIQQQMAAAQQPPPPESLPPQ